MTISWSKDRNRSLRNRAKADAALDAVAAAYKADKLDRPTPSKSNLRAIAQIAAEQFLATKQPTMLDHELRCACRRTVTVQVPQAGFSEWFRCTGCGASQRVSLRSR
jgi:hypothetical protein